MQTKRIKVLEALTNSVGPSGYEEQTAALWEAEARTFTKHVRRDRHGNTFAVVNPGGRPRVMLAGHCDEIGFIVTHIDKEGFLWIAPIGGWDTQIPQGQRVLVRGRKGLLKGVIGKCPIHLMKEEDRKRVVQIKDMWVDIGVKDRKEAEALVEIGDPIVLDHAFELLRGDRAVSRGFDDRVGAFVVLEAARQLARLKPAAEVTAVATVQEEIGLRGARTAAFSVDPEVGLAVDVTFATDHPSMGDQIKQEGEVKLGGGPVLTRGANINAEVLRRLRQTARKRTIEVQMVAEAGGTGTDANAIQLNRDGVAAGLISVPCRYIHSSCEMLSLDDVDRCIELMAYTVAGFKPGDNLAPF